jgi:hypothetical protein
VADAPAFACTAESGTSSPEEFRVIRWRLAATARRANPGARLCDGFAWLDGIVEPPVAAGAVAALAVCATPKDANVIATAAPATVRRHREP